MRLPRDLSGDQLIRKLSRFEYHPTRQTGSHIRLTRQTDEEQQHLTIPRHKPLRIGTLNSILAQAAEQLQMDKQQLIEQLAQ